MYHGINAHSTYPCEMGHDGALARWEISDLVYVVLRLLRNVSQRIARNLFCVGLFQINENRLDKWIMELDTIEKNLFR